MSLNTMQYRGYTATIDYDGDDRLFVGDVMDLADTISFTGRTVEELEAGFATAVDAYLDWCAERGKKPARPFSGRLNLRFDPALHREAALAAAARRTSLNAFLVACIEQGLRAVRMEPVWQEGGTVDCEGATAPGGGGRASSGTARATPMASGRRR
jgi:predicted HicB family RNase H-like nuclease